MAQRRMEDIKSLVWRSVLLRLVLYISNYNWCYACAVLTLFALLQSVLHKSELIVGIWAEIHGAPLYPHWGFKTNVFPAVSDLVDSVLLWVGEGADLPTAEGAGLQVRLTLRDDINLPQDSPPEQDVHPGVQDLVPGGQSDSHDHQSLAGGQVLSHDAAVYCDEAKDLVMKNVANSQSEYTWSCKDSNMFFIDYIFWQHLTKHKTWCWLMTDFSDSFILYVENHSQYIFKCITDI